MKLIIKQYLASLRERDELDAVLPDLLSELGLNVFSRPSRGTRQHGVDVAAVGSLDGGIEKAYLFSIKAGDLTRRSWSIEENALRPSLDEIQDVYIPNCLPEEHKDKGVVICLCLGGVIQENVRADVEGYKKRYTREKLTFEDWNGDRLASLIQSSFLREDLLPEHSRSQLRKSLSLLDEPEASYQHFSTLVTALFSAKGTEDKDQVTAIRQIYICLWILFAWARDAGNTESAYLASELALLYAWEMSKSYSAKTTNAAKAIQSAFQSLLIVYKQISSQYLTTKILPHTPKRDALSAAVRASCSLDVNLKLFDVLGRLSMGGIWAYWWAQRLSEGEGEIREQLWNEVRSCSVAAKQLISNNPTLFLPIKDDQAIDMSIAVLLLLMDRDNHTDISTWLSEVVNRASLAYQIHGKYPCTVQRYGELLEHPRRNDEGYRQEVTSGSILFPMIALWAGLLRDADLYCQVQTIKGKYLGHCNFQFWYPDESSEKHFYTNRDVHGATLSHACIDRSMDDFLEQAFAECELSPHFKTLSAVETGIWPIVLIACRHYRIPVPLHLLEGLRSSVQAS